MTSDELGTVVATLLQETLIPIRASVGVLDERLKHVGTAAAAAAGVTLELAALRERVAVLETRAPVPGPPGAPGRDGLDGVDGFGPDDVSAEYDGERTITLAFARPGREARRIPLALPFLKYQGTYQAGRTYVEGDTVTAAGGIWHCRASSTTARPGEGVTGWQLAVKRGQDGRGPHA